MVGSSKISGYKCSSCTDVFQSRALLYCHRLNQHGLGEDELHPLPWVDESEAPWHGEDGEDSRMRDVYQTNRPHILRSHDPSRVAGQYNYPTNNLNGGVEGIMEHLRSIMDIEISSFKMNLALGYILRNIETEEYKYLIPF